MEETGLARRRPYRLVRRRPYRKAESLHVDAIVAAAEQYVSSIKQRPVLAAKFSATAFDADAYTKTFRQLNKTCNADFDEVPIGDVLELYSKAYKVDFQIEAVALLPVTLKANGAKLEEILRDLLASANCEHFVMPNGVVFVRKIPVQLECKEQRD